MISPEEKRVLMDDDRKITLADLEKQATDCAMLARDIMNKLKYNLYVIRKFAEENGGRHA